MLVSRIWLGINVFEINIEEEGKKKFVSVSKIMTVIVFVVAKVAISENGQFLSGIKDKWMFSPLKLI